VLFQVLSSFSLILIVLAAFYIVATVRKLLRLKKQLTDIQSQLSQERHKETALSAQLTQLKSEVAETILHDPLTGLPGRQIFDDRFSQTLNQSSRYNLIFAILYVDLDEFKVINNALGPDAGDELLKEVGRRLLSCIRQMDTVSRFHGDEFTLLLTQLVKPETAAYVAQRVLDAVSQPFQIRGQELFITASIGIATFPTDGKDAATLLKSAENALHQAKARGCNSYQFCNEEMHTLSKRSLVLSSSLRSGAIYQDLRVYFQPRVHAQEKKIICMEALLHWNQPDFGLIPFAEFSRLAENSGSAIALGEWTLRAACQQFQEWKAQGFGLQNIAVEILPRQLENPHFTYKISQILQEIKLEPSCLILEISESLFSTKLDLIEKALNMLKHLGVRIAISNFGAGNIALQYLRRFPIDYLKISPMLIQHISVNREDEAIVKMIIALANSLQLHVAAEGVESERQKQLLKELGCNLMQGEFFSRPLVPQEFTAAIEKTIAESM
jgi:diguanylate cyclase (GGDEF)-like protein